MKRSPLFWIVVVTLFVLGCLVLTCGQHVFATHSSSNRDPRMSVSSFSPLVLSAGRVSPLPTGDAITMGGGQINNLADPNSPQDAATEAYVLAHATVSGSLTSGFVPVANGASSIVNSLESDNGSVFRKYRAMDHRRRCRVQRDDGVHMERSRRGDDDAGCICQQRGGSESYCI